MHITPCEGNPLSAQDHCTVAKCKCTCFRNIQPKKLVALGNVDGTWFGLLVGKVPLISSICETGNSSVFSGRNRSPPSGKIGRFQSRRFPPSKDSTKSEQRRLSVGERSLSSGALSHPTPARSHVSGSRVATSKEVTINTVLYWTLLTVAK